MLVDMARFNGKKPQLLEIGCARTDDKFPRVGEVNVRIKFLDRVALSEQIVVSPEREALPMCADVPYLREHQEHTTMMDF